MKTNHKGRDFTEAAINWTTLNPVDQYGMDVYQYEVTTREGETIRLTRGEMGRLMSGDPVYCLWSDDNQRWF